MNNEKVDWNKFWDDKTMQCDTCQHKNVCKYKEEYVKTKESSELNDVFNIICKHYKAVELFDTKRYIQRNPIDVIPKSDIFRLEKKFTESHEFKEIY